jgi:hypothetical protein
MSLMILELVTNSLQAMVNVLQNLIIASELTYGRLGPFAQKFMDYSLTTTQQEVDRLIDVLTLLLGVGMAFTWRPCKFFIISIDGIREVFILIRRLQLWREPP